MENVFYLRTPEDANCIAKLANNKNAIVVGASYVGENRYHLMGIIGMFCLLPFLGIVFTTHVDMLHRRSCAHGD